jgi:hypothetical protein
MSSCARRNCPNKDKNVPVHACAHCKQDFYCSRDCQKKSWGTHKHRCISVDTAKQTISELTIDAIRTTIANANPGDVTVLEKGTYEGSGALRINKPIILLGAGKDSTKLCCDGLSIQREDATENQKSESITVADLEVTNSSHIENNNYKSVNLCGIRFSCPIGTRDASRGIFSRESFVIEDVTISHCGAYGIKGTAGWNEKGQNVIQPGPWMNWG